MPILLKKILELIVKNPQYIAIVYELLKSLVESPEEEDKKNKGDIEGKT